MPVIWNEKQVVSPRSQRRLTTDVVLCLGQLEAELRQHFQVENVQRCAAWKKWHSQTHQNYQLLLLQLEQDGRGLLQALVQQQQQQQPQPVQDHQVQAIQALEHQLHHWITNSEDGDGEGDDEVDDHQQQQAEANAPEFVDDQEELRRIEQRDWIQQERFNLQEAFTNQARKLHAESDQTLHHLEQTLQLLGAPVPARHDPQDKQQWTNNNAAATEPAYRTKVKRNLFFDPVQENERFRGIVLAASSGSASPAPNSASGPKSRNKLSNQRHHPLPRRHHPQPQQQQQQQQQHQRQRLLLLPPPHTSATTDDDDVDSTTRYLEFAGYQFALHKQQLEADQHEILQFLGRQCAQLFTQLDCHETWSKLLLCLDQQLQQDTTRLTTRIQRMAHKLRVHCLQLNSCD